MILNPANCQQMGGKGVIKIKRRLLHHMSFQHLISFNLDQHFAVIVLKW